MQAIVAVVVLAFAWLAANWTYQAVRKPSELLFPVSGTLHKTPQETWRAYGPIFRRHSTATISAEFLAALAQIEGSGNPIVRTYWRWSWKPAPFEVYRPASSAVGMYQITNGTFAESRRYCIRDHRVIEDGPWHDWDSCWFNGLYTRIVPTHAVELTSAYLDQRVSAILRRQGITNATRPQKEALAAVIHLCGAGAGNRYAARGLKAQPGQRCGDHDLPAYVRKVTSMKKQFLALAVRQT